MFSWPSSLIPVLQVFYGTCEFSGSPRQCFETKEWMLIRYITIAGVINLVLVAVCCLYHAIDLFSKILCRKIL